MTLNACIFQASDAQPGIPFDQFVVREPVRARQLEMEGLAGPSQPQYGAPASARARQVQYGADREAPAYQRPPFSQGNGASDRTAERQPGQLQFREPRQPGTSSVAGVQRRMASAARPVPDQAWPAATDSGRDPRGPARGEAEPTQEDRLAEIRRELPDWRQERDAPLYNTPYKEYRMRRH